MLKPIETNEYERAYLAKKHKAIPIVFSNPETKNWSHIELVYMDVENMPHINYTLLNSMYVPSDKPRQEAFFDIWSREHVSSQDIANEYYERKKYFYNWAWTGFAKKNVYSNINYNAIVRVPMHKAMNEIMCTEAALFFDLSFGSVVSWYQNQWELSTRIFAGRNRLNEENIDRQTEYYNKMIEQIADEQKKNDPVSVHGNIAQKSDINKSSVIPPSNKKWPLTPSDKVKSENMNTALIVGAIGLLLLNR